VRLQRRPPPQHLSVSARTTDPAERRRLFPRFVEMYKGYGTFEDKTSRQIPLVLLTRTGRTQPREAFAGGDRCR